MKFNVLENKSFCFVILFVLPSIASFGSGDLVDGNLIQFNDNGAWCWYQDERAVIDTIGGKLIVGYVGSDNGVGGPPREGLVESVILDLQSRLPQRYILMDTYCDDHNTPAFLVRPDGYYLSMYTLHGSDYLSRYRIFDGSSWSTEVQFDWYSNIPGGSSFVTTYSNLFYLSSNDQVYNISRGHKRSPNIMVSGDYGDTWSYAGLLSTPEADIGYVNGYFKYYGNGVDRIDFICTEHHPRDYNTSIYHGYIRNDSTFNSFGTFMDSTIYDTIAPNPSDFTTVFADNTEIGGDYMRKIWNADLMRYDDGTIAAILTCRINNAVNYNDTSIDPDHAFIYCRFDGSSWSYTYLGQAGKKTHSSEADYTGLGALHPNDPNTIYISTPYDPRDNSTFLEVREIFKGVTADNGATWSWTPITWNSERDNLRPIVPMWDQNNTALLWWRGTYLSAGSYDAAVVGIIECTSDTVVQQTYVDADLTNTALADGSPLTTTGPDPNQGPADNQWHRRTTFGNGGSVLTSAEAGGEDAPVIKTQTIFSEAGTYDVWANFWANPDEDWRIEAGFHPDSMQIFRQMACKQVRYCDHNTTLMLIGGGNTFLYQAYLGRVELGAGDILEVFIDDEAIQTGTENTLVGGVCRSWYDGISYSHPGKPPGNIDRTVEVVQVLDNSGSMSGSATPVPGSDSKIKVLRDAANLVVDMMDADAGHKLGLVKFSTDATTIMNLQPFTTASVGTAHTAIDGLSATYTTSIGDGLKNAFIEFNNHGDVDNRQVIILMSDGKGNTALGVGDLWAADPDWANSQAIIYTLGLGHDGGICSDTLAWLADSTDGDYRQTTDPIELTKFFIEALASAVGWSPVTDPAEKLPPAGSKSFHVVVSDYDRSVTFTAYWSDIDNAIDLTIYNPNDDSISPSSPEVHYAEGDNYVLYKIQQTESNWAGQWRMEVTSVADDTVTYSTNSLAESSIKLDAGFDKLYTETGDRIRVWGSVMAPSFPLPPPKPEIIAYCNRPLEGVGNVLHEFQYDPDKLKAPDSLADYDPISHKLAILRKQTGKEILPRGTNTLVLYDDGAHEDGSDGDGLYANTFTDTKIQGSYTFRFVASNIPCGSGLKTTREWTKSFYNEVDINPKYSDIDFSLLKRTADGQLYSLKVVPKDRFGNYLGPGHSVAVTVLHNGVKRTITLDDNIDGIYTKEILLTQNEVGAGAKLEIDVDGKDFTTVDISRKWSVSAHAGIAIPTGGYADDFDMGFNVLLDGDYRFTPQLALVGLFGYNNFNSGTVGVDDTYWINASLNLRYYLLFNFPLEIYIGGGPGCYYSENGDIEFGANIGGGINYRINPSITLELGTDYHTILNPDIQFIHSHAGVVFSF